MHIMSQNTFDVMPIEFKDPLTLQPFCDPVILIQTGQSLERYVLEAHLSAKRTCPVTHDILEDLHPLYVPNVALRNAVDQWITSSGHDADGIGPPRPNNSSPMKIDPSRITMHDRIGSGGGGEVWAADLMFASGHTLPVAVKTPDAAGGTAAEERLARELTHLEKANNRRCTNVVRLIGESKLGDRRCAVLARYDGSLADAAAAWAAAPSPPALRRRLGYALDIVRGAAALHSAGLCHLDLRPENVLLHRAADALFVADLDLAVQLRDGDGGAGAASGQTKVSQPVGHPSFIPPEGWQVFSSLSSPAHEAIARAARSAATPPSGPCTSPADSARVC